MLELITLRQFSSNETSRMSEQSFCDGKFISARNPTKSREQKDFAKK